MDGRERKEGKQQKLTEQSWRKNRVTNKVTLSDI